MLESVDGHIPLTYPVLGPNDHTGIEKCGVIRQSRLRVTFNTYTVEGSRGCNKVRSRSNLDLAPSSELHCKA